METCVCATLIVLLMCTSPALTQQDTEDEYSAESMDTAVSLTRALSRLVTRMDAWEAMELRVRMLETQLGHLRGDQTESNTQRQEPPSGYQFSSFGCESDVISLRCREGKTILVQSAEYGQSVYSCAEACCPPHPGRDCVQSVERNHTADWLAVKERCDNSTECAYENLGAVIDGCEAGRRADYMSIYYTCLPEDVNTAVGFTAFHNYAQNYSRYQMLRFVTTETNLGGYFNPASSTFICPAHGLYAFSLTIVGTPDSRMSLFLRRETEKVGGIWMHAVRTRAVQASNMAVVTCAKGQRVYVDFGNYAGVIRGNNDRTSFSGFLIQRFH